MTDEPQIRQIVARLLASERYAPIVADGGEADFGSLAGISLALILINTYRADLNGSEAVERVSAAFPGVPLLHLEKALLGSGSLAANDLLESVRTLTTSEHRAILRPDMA